MYFTTSGPTAQVAWCKMVVALAGIAAEAVTYGRWRSGEAAFDLLTARTYAQHVLRTEPPWPGRPVPERPFERAYSPALTEEEAVVIRQAYAMARHLVVHHQVSLARAAGLLLHRHEVDQTDIELLLGNRALVRVAARPHGFFT